MNKKNAQHTHHIIHHAEGVSLIALVITIIVVIILAAIAFGTSTRTITNANYSDYVNSVAEVRQAFHTRAITVKGMYAARGINLTDAQVYDYVARGGTKESDIRVRADIPEYTIIEDKGQLGIKMPKLRIEAATGDVAVAPKSETINPFESIVYAGGSKMVEMKFATTKEGEIFTWPPFDYEEKFMINDKDTATSKRATSITVGGKTFSITLDEDVKELLNEGEDEDEDLATMKQIFMGESGPNWDLIDELYNQGLLNNIQTIDLELGENYGIYDEYNEYNGKYYLLHCRADYNETEDDWITTCTGVEEVTEEEATRQRIIDGELKDINVGFFVGTCLLMQGNVIDNDTDVLIDGLWEPYECIENTNPSYATIDENGYVTINNIPGSPAVDLTIRGKLSGNVMVTHLSGGK